MTEAERRLMELALAPMYGYVGDGYDLQLEAARREVALERLDPDIEQIWKASYRRFEMARKALVSEQKLMGLPHDFSTRDWREEVKKELESE